MVKTILIVIPLSFSLNSFCQQLTRRDERKIDSVIALHKYFSIEDPSKLARVLTQDESNELLKYKLIFKWVTSNIRYDVDLFNKNEKFQAKFRYNPSKLKKWNGKYFQTAIKHLKTDRKSTCIGYSYLINEMCHEAGISCEIIEGHARGQYDFNEPRRIDHAWNAIKINNNWFLSDPTWGSGYLDPAKKEFSQSYDEQYFLSTPDNFIIDHYPKDKNWVLMANKPTLDEFYSYPFRYPGFINLKINHFEPHIGIQTIQLGHSITFRFTSNTEPKKITVKEVNNLHSFSYDHEVEQEADGYYTLVQPFRTKGLFMVYIYVNHSLILGYQVNVM